MKKILALIFILIFSTTAYANNRFDGFNKWLFENGLSNIEGALLIINECKNIDKFVIGFDNEKQIDDIFEFLNGKKYDNLELPDFKCDEKLINPNLWK